MVVGGGGDGGEGRSGMDEAVMVSMHYAAPSLAV